MFSELMNLCCSNEVYANQIQQLNDQICQTTLHGRTALMYLMTNTKLKTDRLPLIDALENEIGMESNRGATALMDYCHHNGQNVDVINRLKSEIGKQDIEGFSALMCMMSLNTSDLNIDSVIALSDEIGLQKPDGKMALDLFCEYRYEFLDRDLSNQIINILRNEYREDRTYFNVDVRSIIE